MTSLYTFLNAPNLPLAVQAGKINGYSNILKFGINELITPTSDPEDVWQGGGAYPWSTTADIISLSSSSGAANQPIEIQGLDAEGNLVTQTITLTGQTRVALTTPLWRVFRMKNIGTTDIVGTVYCYSGTTNTAGVPSGGSVSKALIVGAANQTLMAIYTIPKGFVGFITSFEVGVEYGTAVPASDTSHFARCCFHIREYGKVFRVQKSITAMTKGNSHFQDTLAIPLTAPALSDLKVQATIVSEDMGVWGTFAILLVPETEFSDLYLASINQPT